MVGIIMSGQQVLQTANAVSRSLGDVDSVQSFGNAMAKEEY
jgi:hypothetical protein